MSSRCIAKLGKNWSLSCEDLSDKVWKVSNENKDNVCVEYIRKIPFGTIVKSWEVTLFPGSSRTVEMRCCLLNFFNCRK